MGLKCGIVGLPNVGKSTLFNTLSSGKAEAANFPFCTIDPNIGIVRVPDDRLWKLKELIDPHKVIPTTIEFVDIAGLVKGASKGEGLGNRFLGNIREVDAIIHVVRCFENDNIIHVDGKIDPVSDKEIVDTEIQLKDLETIDKSIQKLGKVSKSGDVKARRSLEILSKYKDTLESGINARNIEVLEEEKEEVQNLQLLTNKPVIYVANVDEDSIQTGNKYTAKLEQLVTNEKAQVIKLCVALEAQIAELDAEEQKIFLQEYELTESGLDKLIKASYSLLDLITYFTAGKKEVRAWTIKAGTKAPGAAGVIHTDFERGFIKAEVIKWADYIKHKSEIACRDAGKIGVQGKDYAVADGDIMHFRFNV